MKLGNFSQNLSTVIFSKISKFLKFASFYEEQIWCGVIILDEIVFFSKSKAKFICWFPPSIVFGTIYGWYHIY